ncbi:MAG: hypothetical protein RL348_394 [Bacteroidota bacterium]
MSGIINAQRYASIPLKNLVTTSGVPYAETVNNIQTTCSVDILTCRSYVQNLFKVISPEWKAFLLKCGGTSYLTGRSSISCDKATKKLTGTTIPFLEDESPVTATSDLLNSIKAYLYSLA